MNKITEDYQFTKNMFNNRELYILKSLNDKKSYLFDEKTLKLVFGKYK